MTTRSILVFPAGRQSAPRALLQRLLHRVATARAERRQRTRLIDLEPHLLRDIGLTEDDAERAARHALWDVPRSWRR